MDWFYSDWLVNFELEDELRVSLGELPVNDRNQDPNEIKKKKKNEGNLKQHILIFLWYIFQILILFNYRDGKK